MALAVAIALAACAPVATPIAGPGGNADDGAAASSLWYDPPACVVVMPIAAVPALGLAPAAVEAALARQLAGHVDRVVGPDRRAALTRRLGLDLDHPGDRRRFATLTGCRHAALARIDGGHSWAVVWSETRVGLALAVLRLDDGRALWRGGGSARRGDGGLPLSPLSVAVGAGLAARAALDRDRVASVLDDALRAALLRLPDFRDPQAFASRNSSVSPLSSRK